MSQHSQTAAQKLASLILESPLEDYLASKRALGLSWERIARDLHEDTEGQVSVSLKTIQRWADDLEAAS